MNSPNNLTAIDFENAYIQDLGVDISGILPGTRKYKKDYVKEALEEDKKYRRLRRQKIRKQEWEARLTLGADYLYYDLFSQIWGWGKYQYPEYSCRPEDAILQLQSAMQKQQHKNIFNQRPYNEHLQFQIGAAYLMGWLPSDNREQTAIIWFRRSAEQDSEQGLMALGYCYEKEIGGLQDEPENLINTVHFYREAAGFGYTPALYRLARCLFEKEDAASRIQEIKKRLEYIHLHYKPAAELWEEVIALEDKIRGEQEAEIQGTPQKSTEEAFENLLSLFDPVPDDAEDNDNGEDWEDEEDWEDGEDDFSEEDVQGQEETTPVLFEEEGLRESIASILGKESADAWIDQLRLVKKELDHASGEDYYEVEVRYEEAWELLTRQMDEAMRHQEYSQHNISGCAEPEKDDDRLEVASEELAFLSANRTEPSQNHEENNAVTRNMDRMNREMEAIKELITQNFHVMQDINRTVHRNEDKLDTVQENVLQIRKITEGIQHSQKKLWEDLLNETAGEKQKIHIRQLQSETENALAEITREQGSALDNEEKFLALIFGSDWRNEERLCNTACDSLVTARTLMRYGNKVGITNYSGIIITAVASLEIETRRRFFDAYVGYLEEQGTSPQNFPENLTRHKRTDGSFYYTLGALKYILSPRVKGKNPAGEARTRYSDKGEPFYFDNRVDDFLRDRIMSQYAKEVQKKFCYDRENKVFQFYIPAGSEQSFIGLVDTIRKKYRNKAAHADMCVLTREDAEECCGVLGIQIGEERYAQLVSQESSAQAQKDLLNIEGLLKELLRLTKPLQLECKQ